MANNRNNFIQIIVNAYGDKNTGTPGRLQIIEERSKHSHCLPLVRERERGGELSSSEMATYHFWFLVLIVFVVFLLGLLILLNIIADQRA